MGQRTFSKRYFASINFSPKLLRNGNIFRIHTELASYSEAKKTMNTTNVYVILLLQRKSQAGVGKLNCKHNGNY